MFMTKYAIITLLTIGCVPSFTTSSAYLLRSDYSQCAAVAVSDKELLTASHCVRHEIGHNVLLQPRVGVGQRASVVETDSNTDVATLYANDEVDNAPHQLRREPVVGEGVYAVVPEAGWETVDGKVISKAGWNQWDTTISIVPGFSGSPVYAVADGALVGIITSCRGTKLAAGDHEEKTCVKGWSLIAGVK